MDRQQSVLVGGVLIGVGIVWWLNLSWLLLPLVLIAGGVLGYQQRRRMGDTIGAVQAGLWLSGLGLLFLLQFMFPGILLLAGVSILLRGRELQADDQLHALLGRLTNRTRAPRVSANRQSVPITTEHTTDVPVSNETTRL